MKNARNAMCLSLLLSLAACDSSAPQPFARALEVTNARHRAAHRAAKAAQQSHPVAPRAVGGLGGALQGGQISTTSKNGRVADIITRWYTDTEGTETPVLYIVYSFLSDNLLATGELSDTAPATNTEIWRYANNTWCPVVSRLPFAVTAVADVAAQNFGTQANPLHVQFLVGTADGVVGKFDFIDHAPTQTTCDMAQFEEVEVSEERSFYHVYGPAISPGAVTKIRVAAADESYLPEAQQTFKDYRFVYTWGGQGCVDVNALNADGTCQNYVSQPIRVFVLDQGILSPTQVKSPQSLLLDPSGDPSPINPTANLTYDFDVAISTNETSTFRRLLFTHTFSNNGFVYLSDTKEVDVPLGSDAVVPPSGRELFWRPAYQTSASKTEITTRLTRGTSEPTIDIALQQPFAPVSAPADNQTECPSRGQCGRVATPFQAENQGTWKGDLHSRFSVVRAALPHSQVPSWLPGRDATPVFMATVANGSSSPPAVGLRARVSTGWIGAGRTLPLNDQFLSKPTSDRATAFLSSLDSEIALTPDGGRYFVSMMFADFSADDEDGTQHQLVHGGVVFCSARLTQVTGANGYFAPLVPEECLAPRIPGGGFSAPGADLAAAADIFPGQSFMTAPALVRMSVSPTGHVLVTYVSLKGGIAIINATNGETNWRSDRSWIAISQGRPAECNAVLFKPPAPNPPAKTTFRQKLGYAAISGLTTLVVDVGAEAAFGPAGVLVSAGYDIVHSVYEQNAEQKREQADYDDWKKVYDDTRLDTVCTGS